MLSGLQGLETQATHYILRMRGLNFARLVFQYEGGVAVCYKGTFESRRSLDFQRADTRGQLLDFVGGFTGPKGPRTQIIGC